MMMGIQVTALRCVVPFAVLNFLYSGVRSVPVIPHSVRANFTS